jgi:CubicO group peptidase (beta-lactamase class C family)
LPLNVLLMMALGCVGAEPKRFDAIDAAVEKSIAAGDMPGCVVLVLHKDEVKYRKAFGLRAKQPVEDKMTPDTIFDLASLTKPIATATSIWILIEQGKLKLDDPVAKHWPEFGANGKDKVTIEHLLLHTSGLIADNPLADYADGKQKAFERIAALKLEAPAGSRFKYSDVGFIVLGHLMERLSKDELNDFAAAHIFTPLRMNHTQFGAVEFPFGSGGPFIAPTERDGTKWLRGVVHDPRARKLQSECDTGHAGLFSTADDLARYCRMILRGGELDGKRILKPETMKLMTEPVKVPGGGLRTRGWDCDTSYSKNRGDVFPKGKSFGHTGFTGTSIWIDPGSQTAVIFLSSRLHPDGKGNVTKIRGEVATLAARALGLYNE